MLQRPAELMPGAMDVRLDGAKRQVEGAGDLFVRSALDVPQHYAGSVLGAQAADRAFDGGAQLLGLHLLERVLGLVADVEAR